MRDKDPFSHTFAMGESSPAHPAEEAEPLVDYLQSPRLLETLYPDAKATLDQFSPQQLDQLDHETKAVTGGGLSFNDLHALYERTKGKLEINYTGLVSLLGQWHGLWMARSPHEYVDPNYSARTKIAKKISDIIEAA